MSSQQPLKKPRLDSEDDSATVSNKYIPLVNPHQVKRSSKDPNRGLYPRRRNSRNCNDELAGPSTSTFTKASELIKHSLRKTNRKSSCMESESQHSASYERRIITRGMKKSMPTKVKSECSTSSLSNHIPLDPTLKTLHTKASDQSESSCNNSETSPLVSDVEYFDSDEDQLKISRVKRSRETNDIRFNKRGKAVSIKGVSPKYSLEKNKITNYFKSSHEEIILNSNAKAEDFTKETLIRISSLRTDEYKNKVFFEKFDKCYGLLGEAFSNENDEKFNYFEKLPDHIMETIFCQIPILDLLSCRLVCKLWNKVISSNTFMDWKMNYYRLKLQDDMTVNKLKRITTDLGLKSVEDTFKVLIRFIAQDYKRKPSSDMYAVLVKNKLAATAERVLNERFPDICTSESKPWTIFTLAMLLSRSVWDIYDLYQTLFHGKTYCSVLDVTNTMYCVATFLLYFRNRYSINYGLGYNIYYVLYMIENKLPSEKIDGAISLSIPKGLPGQHSLHSYCDAQNSTLTYEQMRILNHHFQPNQRIKIVALAGTGKTTTLIQLALMYPQIKFLNIVYNKVMCESARKRFPPNVTCITMHGLAYSYKGAKLRYKLVKRLRPHDLIKHLEYKEGSSLHVYSYARHVMAALTSYITSAAPELSLSDVSEENLLSKDVLSESCRTKILNDAKNIWTKMIDDTNAEVKITHDVYLKLYQLKKPKLSSFQCIMVDEAQDYNPAMLDVLLHQALPVIFVGDPNQQIYGFRGANNALQSIEATHTYHLTKSFRFGPDIAYFASCILESLKEITSQTLVGTGEPSFINGRTYGQYAIISRTNKGIFNEAIRLISSQNRRDYEPATINGAVVGGLESLGLQQLLDICKLAEYYKNPDYVIKDKFIAKFKSYLDLTTYAKNSDDTELLNKIDLVKTHNNKLPEYIKTIKNKFSYPLNVANVILCTAHKSKGLEFDTVCLTDDYPLTKYANFRQRAIAKNPKHEEFNIFYVAATRAKTCLLVNEKMHSILNCVTNEKFEYPVSSESLIGNDEELYCVSCKDTFKPHTVLTPVRREVVLSSGRKIVGGPMCMKCRTNPRVRMRVEMEPVIMYSDPLEDKAHLSMSSLVGLLPSDPPIAHGPHAAFQDMDVVYIINVRL